MSEPDWYLKAWLEASGVRFPHAWLQKTLGTSKGTASHVLNGRTRYTRDLVNRIAAALEIEPHELLMSPDRARRARALDDALRSIREST